MMANKNKNQSQINANNLPRSFKLYLLHTRELSKRTVKNYMTDFRHFIEWVFKATEQQGNKATKQLLTLKVEELTEAAKIDNINKNLLKRYRAYLSATDLAKSTVKRRLSTIRIFCQFLLDQNLVDKDPSIGLENPSDQSPEEEKIEKLVTKFQRYLNSEEMSQNTVKNYIADARGYLEWAVNAE